MIDALPVSHTIYAFLNSTDRCRFTSLVDGDQEALVLETKGIATLLAAGSTINTFEIACPTPAYAPDQVVGATFDAKFEILEGTRKLAWDVGMQAPNIKFHTVGPVISGRDDTSFYLSLIKADTTSYPNGRLSLSFLLSDADSHLANISFTFSSSNTNMLPSDAISVAGEMRISGKCVGFTIGFHHWCLGRLPQAKQRTGHCM